MEDYKSMKQNALIVLRNRYYYYSQALSDYHETGNPERRRDAAACADMVSICVFILTGEHRRLFTRRDA